ncbi:MAG: CpsD/CapB family tyrosine-protein kinase [Caldilinea sp.]|uniref:CpsD/CapB family tyrosine-protein kinase n=1 Tax=Caldilinea sp. TaxID=2293560 RepID=UPI002C036756|nr:CpsD/CapB family tyrosine-protein kinase [Anaerolineales bacterium]HQY92278.1 CpsD/CapB family tyrosine-protein kinase [Caldilinea sp.]HRA67776.1 CpsD/CapB family tyrosine-protein kinase [Caldilinea sp.]
MNLITLSEPHSPAAEAYQSLRTSLEFSSLEKPVRSILVAAVDGGIDKAAAVANLAVVMAQSGDRVILVDGDLRQPHQHELLGVANATGLAQWIDSGGPPPLLESTIDKLRVLPSGPSVINPVALLSTKRLGERLAELVALADYVIIDAPPLLHVTDAALWASQVDGVVLLVNGGSTKKEQALRAKGVLARVQAHLLGAVLLNAE